MSSQNIKVAVGYVRVSTEMQAEDGASLETQQQNIMDYCLRKKLLFHRFYVDSGFSGKNMERDELQLMLSELKPGSIVICAAIDRLSRSVTDLQTIRNKITEKGGTLEVINMPVDFETDEGDLQLGIMSHIAQYERRCTARRVSNVMTNMSREGTLITKPRFGYRIVKEGKVSNVVENPDEQLVLNKIRQLIQDDPKITVSAIVKILTKDQIKIRKAKKIYPDTISKIIKANNLRDV